MTVCGGPGILIMFCCDILLKWVCILPPLTPGIPSGPIVCGPICCIPCIDDMFEWKLTMFPCCGPFVVTCMFDMFIVDDIKFWFGVVCGSPIAAIEAMGSKCVDLWDWVTWLLIGPLVPCKTALAVECGIDPFGTIIPSNLFGGPISKGGVIFCRFCKCVELTPASITPELKLLTGPKLQLGPCAWLEPGNCIIESLFIGGNDGDPNCEGDCMLSLICDGNLTPISIGFGPLILGGIPSHGLLNLIIELSIWGPPPPPPPPPYGGIHDMFGPPNLSPCIRGCGGPSNIGPEPGPGPNLWFSGFINLWFSGFINLWFIGFISNWGAIIFPNGELAGNLWFILSMKFGTRSLICGGQLPTKSFWIPRSKSDGEIKSVSLKLVFGCFWMVNSCPSNAETQYWICCGDGTGINVGSLLQIKGDEHEFEPNIELSFGNPLFLFESNELPLETFGVSKSLQSGDNVLGVCEPNIFLLLAFEGLELGGIGLDGLMFAAFDVALVHIVVRGTLQLLFDTLINDEVDVASDDWNDFGELFFEIPLLLLLLSDGVLGPGLECSGRRGWPDGWSCWIISGHNCCCIFLNKANLFCRCCLCWGVKFSSAIGNLLLWLNESISWANCCCCCCCCDGLQYMFWFGGHPGPGPGPGGGPGPGPGKQAELWALHGPSHVIIPPLGIPPKELFIIGEGIPPPGFIIFPLIPLPPCFIWAKLFNQTAGFWLGNFLVPKRAQWKSMIDWNCPKSTASAAWFANCVENTNIWLCCCIYCESIVIDPFWGGIFELMWCILAGAPGCCCCCCGWLGLKMCGDESFIIWLWHWFSCGCCPQFWFLPIAIDCDIIDSGGTSPKVSINSKDE